MNDVMGGGDNNDNGSQEKTIHKDALDVILEASKKLEISEIEGKMERVLINDFESIYWGTRNVASANFSRFVLKLKELENLGKQSKNHMMPERAKIIEDGILAIVTGYKYSIDAKSSESVLDKDNKQTTLVDKFFQQKIEKRYTTNEKIKKGLLASFIGKDQEDD